MEKEVYQSEVQVRGSKAHQTIDTHSYSNRKDVLQAIPVYSEKYNLIGEIDTLDLDKKELVERKKHVTRVYDGFVFQLYAQYYCLVEMGYEVRSLKIHSYDDNKNYPIPLPEEDSNMKEKFEQIISDINSFDPTEFKQTNAAKCMHCIYFESCDRGISC